MDVIKINERIGRKIHEMSLKEFGLFFSRKEVYRET